MRLVPAGCSTRTFRKIQYCCNLSAKSTRRLPLRTIVPKDLVERGAVCLSFCDFSNLVCLGSSQSPSFGSRLSRKKLRQTVEESDAELYPFALATGNEAGMACRVHAVLYECKVEGGACPLQTPFVELCQ